jgi:magnesium chelatase subunit I
MLRLEEASEVNGRARKQSAGFDALSSATAHSDSLDVAATTQAPTAFPFSAIVGQDEMRLALMIAAVDASLGGVLILGDRGTGKSTGVRSLSALLPRIEVVAGCPCGCAPDSKDPCYHCREAREGNRRGPAKLVPVPMVDLPLGATEDRVLGSLDLERALVDGVKAFQAGLLARANRGFLYIDEVNLLEDHIVDLLIDVSASGVNIFERDGLSVRHPARFVLVGSGNPEEGDLRPQLLDRFGLCVEVRTPTEISTRVEIVKRRELYERDPAAFCRAWSEAEHQLRRQITSARACLSAISVPDTIVARAAQLGAAAGSDGSRGDLTLMRAARALTALEGKSDVGIDELRRTAAMALRHRLRRNPLDESGSSARIARVIEEQLAS